MQSQPCDNHCATTSSTINFSNPRQRPQSARRVPRQRHSQTSSKKRARVPSRLRPYLNAILSKHIETNGFV